MATNDTVTITSAELIQLTTYAFYMKHVSKSLQNFTKELEKTIEPRDISYLTLAWAKIKEKSERAIEILEPKTSKEDYKVVMKELETLKNTQYTAEDIVLMTWEGF
ncbi:hypothetical protein [Streptococcus suis]|uniref:hypothetical protein n=1 Tax=Streptococcus suis TaxID=1307 RepID=UPI0003F84440|nr:hypothetical protein [Streptococcus suis]NQH20983.1 hypothetical protein [Streptococcus suis]CYU94483.1 Uncharacterised protein [Streptococcus suis]HEM2799186.1 hypothetical protein [Streptococcus suis]HEM3209320.1 hypothetical protein [Streptococcus suis 22083]